MFLTNEEEEILKGKEGLAKKFAMEILIKVGNLFRAKRLIPIKYAHVHGHYGSLHDAGMEIIEKFASLGAKYSVPTTINPSSISVEGTEISIPNEYAEKQKRLRIAHEVMGVYPNWSCCPYYVVFPMFGDCIAWAESSAVVYANSVIGARTNRMSTGLEIAASIIGKIPEFGLYITENRFPKIEIEIKIKNLYDEDFHALGYLLGKLCERKVPFIKGISGKITLDDLKALGASAASSGALELYHIENITAEVKGGLFNIKKRKLEKKFTITKEDLKKVKQKISTTSGEVNIVMLGCPHYSVEEMKKLVKLIKGRKISNNLPLWVYTSSRVKAICRGLGILELLRKSNVKVISGTCPVISPLNLLNIRSIMVNSAKAANVIPSEHNIDVAFASTQECVNTAILGRRL